MYRAPTLPWRNDVLAGTPCSEMKMGAPKEHIGPGRPPGSNRSQPNEGDHLEEILTEVTTWISSIHIYAYTGAVVSKKYHFYIYLSVDVRTTVYTHTYMCSFIWMIAWVGSYFSYRDRHMMWVCSLTDKYRALYA